MQFPYTHTYHVFFWSLCLWSLFHLINFLFVYSNLFIGFHHIYYLQDYLPGSPSYPKLNNVTFSCTPIYTTAYLSHCNIAQKKMTFLYVCLPFLSKHWDPRGLLFVFVSQYFIPFLVHTRYSVYYDWIDRWMHV